MSDFIKREDVVEAVYKALRTPLPDYRNDFFHDSMSYAIEIVNNIPSVEPEQKMEKSLLDKEKVIIEPFTTDMTHVGYCICGYLVNADWSYCPKCGRMIIWGVHYE